MNLATANVVQNVNDSGPGSLRQAIADAAPGSTITFDSSLSGAVLSLETGQLVIDKDLTIDASSLPGGFFVDGNSNGDLVLDTALNETRCFLIDDGDDDNNIDVSIIHLTVQNGVVDGRIGGGNINNRENLTLTSSRVLNGRVFGSTFSEGGGIWSAIGSLTLLGVVVDGNEVSGDFTQGGGILNATGDLMMDACTVTNNRAIGSSASGGGIYHRLADFTLTGSTVAGNEAALGGGITSSTKLSGETTSFNGCTLVFNESTIAGGALFNSRGRTVLAYCTIVGNSAPDDFGGGVASYGRTDTETEAILCIIADNSSDDVDYVDGTTNSFTSNGYNLIGSGNATGAFSSTGDNVIGSDSPQLGPLADNGSVTLTMHPLPGSPAVDAGFTTDPGGFDQRGAPRFSGSAVDIGAVEVLASPVTVDIAADENNAPIPGSISLREAITFSAPGSTINFDAALSGAVLSLERGGLNISKPLTIDASALPDGFIVDGNSNGDFVLDNHLNETYCFFVEDFDFDTELPVTFIGLTVRNGVFRGEDAGANIYNREALTLRDCQILNGRAFGGDGDADGGGIYSQSGSLVMENCLVSGNQTQGEDADGGGLFAQSSILDMTNCRIIGNQSSGEDADGGGLSTFMATVTLEACTISGNVADGDSADGGGIASRRAILFMDNCTVSGNEVTGNSAFGGGISARNTQVWSETRLNQCTIAGNSAPPGQGGGYFNGGSLNTLVNCTIAGNTGGGILTGEFGLTSLANCLVAANSPTDLDAYDDDSLYYRSEGYNLVGAVAPDWIDAFTETGDMVIGSASPLLAPLGDYGGPTQTKPPMPGSPAIDAGDPATSETSDQRGQPRLNGPQFDIGAVEAHPLSTANPTDTDNDGIPDLFEGPDGPYPHLQVRSAPDEADAALDTDGDGSTDAEEIGNMTNLYDPQDVFRITAFHYAGPDEQSGHPQYTITFRSYPGLHYRFEHDMDVGFSDPTIIPVGPAGDYTTTSTVTLHPGGRDFIRAVREPGDG